MTDHRPATLLADEEGVVRMASTGAAALLGSSPSDLEGLRLDELIESPGRGVIESILAGLQEDAGSAPQRLAVTLRLGGGRMAEADLRLAKVSAPDLTVPGERGGPAGLLIAIELLDGSGRGGARAERGSVSALAPDVAAAATQDAVMLVRGDTVLDASEELAGLVGVLPTTLRGWRVKGLIEAEDLLPVVEILRGVEAGVEERADFGFRMLRAEGRAPIEVSARARRIVHRGHPAVLLGLRDISDSLRAARFAADRLAHLDAALDASSEAVLLLGPAERGSPVLLASRSLERIFRVDTAGWLGRPFEQVWGELMPLHARPEEEDRSIQALLDDPQSVRIDTVTLASPAGRVLERFTSPVRGAADEPIGRIMSFRDVTARVQAEAEMRRSTVEAQKAREELELLHEETRLANEGLELRMAELHRLNKDLKTLDEMKSNLLANVSHELQTPLVSVKGFTEMILKGRLGEITPEQERGLQVALRNINRLIGLIANLLAFARGEGSDGSLRLQSFPLSPLLDEAIELARGPADERGIGIRLRLPQDDPSIRADRDRILQVLLNLIGNAVRYNRDGGEVEISVEPGRRDDVRVEVRDTGIGIPGEDLDRIFDRRARGSNVEGVVEGSGLGLSIVRDILRQHGCTIRAESEEGKGSAFTFNLPLSASPARAPAQTAESQPQTQR